MGPRRKKRGRNQQNVVNTKKDSNAEAETKRLRDKMEVEEKRKRGENIFTHSKYENMKFDSFKKRIRPKPKQDERALKVRKSVSYFQHKFEGTEKIHLNTNLVAAVNSYTDIKTYENKDAELEDVLESEKIQGRKTNRIHIKRYIHDMKRKFKDSEHHISRETGENLIFKPHLSFQNKKKTKKRENQISFLKETLSFKQKRSYPTHFIAWRVKNQVIIEKAIELQEKQEFPDYYQFENVFVDFPNSKIFFPVFKAENNKMEKIFKIIKGAFVDISNIYQRKKVLFKELTKFDQLSVQMSIEQTNVFEFLSSIYKIFRDHLSNHGMQLFEYNTHAAIMKLKRYQNQKKKDENGFGTDVINEFALCEIKHNTRKFKILATLNLRRSKIINHSDDDYLYQISEQVIKKIVFSIEKKEISDLKRKSLDGRKFKKVVSAQKTVNNVNNSSEGKKKNKKNQTKKKIVSASSQRNKTKKK